MTVTHVRPRTRRASRPSGRWSDNTDAGGKRIRLRLTALDGRKYLDRWGIRVGKSSGIFVHRITGPDPGEALHDHPWSFWSFVLWGGYTEERALCREAPLLAQIAGRWPETCTAGVVAERRRGSWKLMRLDECHRIVALKRRTCWTLVVHGPRRRPWGFYAADGWVREDRHDARARVA